MCEIDSDQEELHRTTCLTSTQRDKKRYWKLLAISSFTLTHSSAVAIGGDQWVADPAPCETRYQTRMNFIEPVQGRR